MHLVIRAIAHQIAITDGLSNSQPHEYIRKIAADELRKNKSQYIPFLPIDDTPLSYEDYCKNVESPTSAIWGGQVEIQAIANALNRAIIIFNAESTPININSDATDNKAIHITFHLHYFTLGEHYNSTEYI